MPAQAVQRIRSLMETWPPMKPLALVLKIFLQQRELNEVFTGGLGSYAVLTALAAFLQMHPSRRPRRGAKTKTGPGALETNLGVLLIDFFQLYGHDLDTLRVRGWKQGRKQAKTDGF